jgi:hypothetical protein
MHANGTVKQKHSQNTNRKPAALGRLLWLPCLAALALSTQATVLTNCTETDLRDAMSAGGIIQFACDGAIALTNEIVVSQDTQLDATGHSVTLSGCNSNRIFTIAGGVTLSLAHLILSDGRAAGTNGVTAPDSGGDGFGGAILNLGGTLSALDCTFAANNALGGSGGNDVRYTSEATYSSPGMGGQAFGGAICNLGGHLFLTSTQFKNNLAYGGSGGANNNSGTSGKGNSCFGGAIYSKDGAIVMSNCVFQANTAYGGNSIQGRIYSQGGDAFGGAVFATNCAIELNQTVLSNNIASGGWTYCNASGGGMHLVSSSFQATNCCFERNEATGGHGVDNYRGLPPGDGNGGALWLSAGIANIVGSSFVSNTASPGGCSSYGGGRCASRASSGGGIYNQQTTLDMVNCTFYGNRTMQNNTLYPGFGSSLCNDGGTVTLTHVTSRCFWSFSSIISTGGNDSIQLRNSVILGHENDIPYGGLATCLAGNIIDGGGNLCSDNTANFTQPTSRTNTDPQLGSLGYYGGFTPTAPLLPGSPAIDAGDPRWCLATDQRAYSRTSGASCDSGAFEFRPSDFSLLPTAVTLTAVGTNSTIAISGSTVPNDTLAAAWFEWGSTAAYGNTTTPQTGLAPFRSNSLSATLNSIQPGVVYHFRLVATNSVGMTCGADAVFEAPLVLLAGASPLTNECHYPFTDPGAAARLTPLALAAGPGFSLALRADFTVAGWGHNLNGALNIPSGLTNVSALSAGSSGTILALKRDSTVTAWGQNAAGQANIPAGLSNVVGVAAGGFHSLALKSDGTVAAWGTNGAGGDASAAVPAGLSNIIAVAAGDFFSIALRRDGSLLGWGSGFVNDLAIPGDLTNATQIAAGPDFILALKGDGTVVAWGDNTSAQTNVPAGLTNVIGIAAGKNFALALRSNGSAVSWGASGLAVPTRLTNLTAIAAGATHALALKADGSVVAWGSNGSGETTVSASQVNTFPATTIAGSVDSTTPGTYLLTYTATSPQGIQGTITRTVIVADTTPPTIGGPTNLLSNRAVEFASDDGAAVSFTIDASDLCSPSATLECTPPSGTVFPFGTTQVHCAAHDVSGNTNSASFQVIVLGARGTHSNTLSQLNALAQTVSAKAVKDALRAASNHLDLAMAASLWLDETHVSRARGGTVFDESQETLRSLVSLLRTNSAGIESSDLTALVERILKANRLLATIFLKDAAATGYNTTALAQAWEDVSSGDLALANAQYELANQFYQSAWLQTPQGPKVLIVCDTGGAISADLNGKTLQAGKTYSLTAKATNINYLFSGWTGSIITNSPTLKFVAKTNMVLHATFAPNQFPPAVGTYTGLFVDSENPDLASAGSLSLTLTSKGQFSAKLTQAAISRSFSGSFSTTGASSNVIKLSPTNLLSLALQLDLTNTLLGTVQAGGWQSSLEAHRTKLYKPASAQKFTLVLPGTAESALKPGGYGYATLALSTAGTATLSGTLADGLKLSLASSISQEGKFPVFASLNSGKEAILGWQTITNTEDSDLQGTLYWLKQAKAKAPYPSGFALETHAVGSRYTNAVSMLPGYSGARLILDLGGFTNGFTNWVSLPTASRPGGKLLKLNFSTGIFLGSVTNPAAPHSKPITFGGVVLQKQNCGAGYFLNTNLSGRVSLLPKASE